MTRLFSVQSKRAAKIHVWRGGARQLDYHDVYTGIAKGAKESGSEEQVRVIKKLRDLETTLADLSK